MTSTIDNINTNIVEKINTLQNVLNIYDNYNLQETDQHYINTYIAQLEELLNTYEFGSIDLLKKYYKMADSDLNKHEIYNKFIKFINAENITGILKRIHGFCCRIMRTYEMNEPVLFDHFRLYDNTSIDTELMVCNISENCTSCNSPYSTEAKTSELICKKCGNTEKLYGIVFEDEQFFYQEGQRTKHGKYDPTKHCKFWVDRIQAKENTNIPKKVLNAIRNCIKRDSMWFDRLNCKMIRSYLKELKLTDYNDHVALIRKLITGKEPPQLEEAELRMIYVYFGLVTQIYNKTKPVKKPNCPYHPYFIYKIIEQILKKPDDQRRKEEILSSIHLQSRETLIENDMLWANIVENIPEFKYIPTDSS